MNNTALPLNRAYYLPILLEQAACPTVNRPKHERMENQEIGINKYNAVRIGIEDLREKINRLSYDRDSVTKLIARLPLTLEMKSQQLNINTSLQSREKTLLEERAYSKRPTSNAERDKNLDRFLEKHNSGQRNPILRLLGIPKDSTKVNKRDYPRLVSLLDKEWGKENDVLKKEISSDISLLKNLWKEQPEIDREMAKLKKQVSLLSEARNRIVDKLETITKIDYNLSSGENQNRIIEGIKSNAVNYSTIRDYLGSKIDDLDHRRAFELRADNYSTARGLGEKSNLYSAVLEKIDSQQVAIKVGVSR